MTTYSGAAQAYATARPRTCTWHEGFSSLCDTCRIALAAFDAGAAHATASASAEPERLTNPDDPRIRDGALLAFESSETDGTHFTMRKRVCDAKGATYTAEWHRDIIRSGSNQRVYLLAEAPEPEPDADVLTALLDAWTPGSPSGGFDAVDTLAHLRSAGYDITRKP